MARKDKHNVDEVVKSLTSKGCKIDVNMKVVNIAHATGLGNGSWGRIDFLVNHNGYTLLRS